MGQHVLVVDDEELIRRSLRLTLEAEGYEVTTAGSAAEGRAQLEREPPDCAVLDLRLGDGSGLDLLKEARIRQPGLKAILITAHGDLDSAVGALRLGAYDFVRKPFELEEVVNSVANALRTERLEERVAYFEGRDQRSHGGLIFESAAMRKAMEQVDRFAVQPVPVILVQGESGTGKELVARALHDRSSRRAGPLVELNCSALPEQLVESELFGHERGAFSDAREQKKGLVELADGGTLFLDEIGDLAPAAQAKLLKFVETKELRRVGGTRTLKVDCRIIAATHRDLADPQRFRPDLYFRLAGLTINLPPLRERGEDVLLLARHFLAEFSHEYRKPLTGFSPEAERALMRHAWPGNVRELRAAISFAAMMAEQSVIQLELPEPVLRASVIPPPPKRVQDIVTLEEIQVQYCRSVLGLFRGNRLVAAEKLGINRHTLAKKVGEPEGDEPA